MTKNSEEIKIMIEILSATLSGMKNILNINSFLEKVRCFMEGIDEENREILQGTLSTTTQRKLACHYADHMKNNTDIPLSPIFQEKLAVYWPLSVHLSAYFGDERSDNGTEKAAGIGKGSTSSVMALIEMQALTQAAVTSSKEGTLFDCYARLQEGRVSPQTRSAANSCLRYLERSLCEQILAKGNKLGLYRDEAIRPWYELNESLQGKPCRRHPKEYFEFFRYCPEQQAFSFDSDAFDRATRPF